MHRQGVFPRFANWVAAAAGRPLTFVVAVGIVVIWGISGPLFGFSDTWQLVINTGTTIITFLMVFLIQSTQNRDGEAMQVKLDELIRSIEGAQNALIGLEGIDGADLDEFRDQYRRLAEEARAANAGTAVDGQPAAPGATRHQ